MKLGALIFPLLTASSLGAGCFLLDDELPSCVEGVKAGDQLQVTVIQRWQAPDAGVDAGDGVDSFGRTGASCERDDIKPGDTFTIQLSGEDRRSPLCKVLSCSDDFPSPSTPSGTTLVSFNTPLCSTSHRKVALTSSCEAERSVALSEPLWRARVSVPSAASGTSLTLIVTRALAVSRNERASYACDEGSTVFPDAGVTSSGWYCTDSYLVSATKK